jgi:NAD(P)-dependent dehydrogenase (short-subunit alcohol dehydrogenase family)
VIELISDYRVLERMGFKVVVTGASGGIGRATALRFSKDGHEVFITGRSGAKLEETVSLAKEAGGGVVHKSTGDVGSEVDVQRNYEEAIKALGHIDVLVLNAGTSWTSPLEEHSVADFDKLFNTNVRGVFLWLKLALPAFKKERFAQIVIVNSVLGLGAQGPNNTGYTATKYALTGLAEGLRMEVKGTGIKVGSVFPAAVDTGIWDVMNVDKTHPDVRNTFGLDSALLPEDISDAIATIVYQDPRSDIDLLRIWPNYGPRKALK